MAASPSIKVTKTISWKGGVQQWSNRYHFDGTLPPDSATWTVLSDAIVAAEKLIYKSFISIVGTTGYPASSDVPVFSKVYSQAGTASTLTGDVQASEVAALLRYTTAKRSTKNHPVYLFNYFHGVFCTSGTTVDTLLAAQKTLIETYGSAWISGFSDGSVTHHRTAPDGTLALTRVCEQYVTHRDFR